VLADGKTLPQKYAFLALPHEKRTPDQRRWKWVKFEFLPEDMKPFIRPPKQETEKKDTKRKPGKATEAAQEAANILKTVDLVDDRDLDFARMDNVYLVLTKYRQQQISRRNFNPQLQLIVLDMIKQAQADNQQVQVEVHLLKLNTLFSTAKVNAQGFFSRQDWIDTHQTFDSLLDLLATLPADQKAAKEEPERETERFHFSKVSQIMPAIVTFIEKLDHQLFKALQTAP
jgi:hypothetical protein